MSIDKITEDELGQMQTIDIEIQMMVERLDLQEFQRLSQTHGKPAVIGLLYKQFEVKYGGPLRAMSMLRRTPFYDESSF